MPRGTQRGREVETQTKIAAEMQRLGIEMGVFVAYKDFQNPTLTSGNKDELGKALEEMKKAVIAAYREVDDFQMT